MFLSSAFSIRVDLSRFQAWWGRVQLFLPLSDSEAVEKREVLYQPAASTLQVGIKYMASTTRNTLKCLEMFANARETKLPWGF